MLYISFTAFLWSSSGLFIKILSVSAFHILFYRSVIASATILGILYFRERKLDFKPDVFSVLASASYSGILIFFVIANKMTTSANAIFLQFTAPLYLLFLEPLFLKTKFRPRDLITIIICIAGMALFFMEELEAGSFYGNLIAVGSGICFAFFSLFLKWKKNLGHENAIMTIVFGNLLVAAICLPLIFTNMRLDATQFLILLYMGIFQIGVSYFIFNIGMKYVSATESLIIGILEAVFNPVWVFLGVGEIPSVNAITGGAVIFAAIIVHNLMPLKKSGPA
ncbi:MAG: DMT family transporter [Ignavibacteria bacterium]|nr:DMT family transporter [Ignavibacteria bacterium]